MAESTTPGYDQYELEGLRDYLSPELNEAVQQCDEAEASSTYGPYPEDTMSRDMSAVTHNEGFHGSLALRPSAHPDLSHGPAREGNALGETNVASTFGNDWDRNGTWYPANSSHPHFNLIPPDGSSTWTNDPRLTEQMTMLHQNSHKSFAVSNDAYHWQNSTQQANFGPWNPLSVNYGTVHQLDGSQCYNSNVSTMDHRSSGDFSTMSFTGATTTSRTSDFDHNGMVDSSLTEQQSWYQPGYSTTAGDNALSPMAQTGSLPVVIGVHSRSSSIQPGVHDNGDPAILSSQGNAAHTAAGPPDGNSVECKFPGCMQRFSGTHRRGTMHRHMRLKHGAGPERNFPCRATGCGKTFKRQDARLKHYRSKHPEFRVAAPMPRKDKYSS